MFSGIIYVFCRMCSEKISENRNKNSKKYFLQAYVDSGDTIESGFSAYSAEEMLKLLENTRKLLPITEIRGV